MDFTIIVLTGIFAYFLLDRDIQDLKTEKEDIDLDILELQQKIRNLENRIESK